MSGKRLTKNFSLSEFFVSNRFPDLARRAKYLRDRNVDDFIFLLCKYILQPVRDYYHVPVIITSGFRDYKLNQLLLGSQNSLHQKGMAADFTTENKLLLHFIYDFIYENLSFSELIIYVDQLNQPINIHVSLPVIGKKPIAKKIIKEMIN